MDAYPAISPRFRPAVVARFRRLGQYTRDLADTLGTIHTEDAAALPGVRAVATAADFPIMAQGGIDFAQLQGNARMIAENVLAHAKVLYKGHAVAAVAATDRHIAAEALTLIEVDYEILPTVLTLHDAMQPEAPLLHEAMTTRFRV